jgi:D-alanyl-D-alanine carboxypeptidase/D-alanyl-D-alanine-endopeptidase (penicillin-binding protein 4)
MKNHTVMLLLVVCWWQACAQPHVMQPAAAGNPIQQYTEEDLLRQPGLLPAQVGICLYDPEKASFLYSYQGDKFFIPASNTKLFSLYAGMKYLGDSLIGMRYRQTDTALFVLSTGDPTLLHPAYPDQPVVRLLQRATGSIYLTDLSWQEKPLGRGWAWDDYNDDYMSERSPFPVYGNLIRWLQDTVSQSYYSVPDISWQVRFATDSSRQGFLVRRDFHANAFEITEGKGRVHEQDVPFITDGIASAAGLLKDTIGRTVWATHQLPSFVRGLGAPGSSTVTPGSPAVTPGSSTVSPGSPASIAGIATGPFPGFTIVHSRPVDSLFRPMMYNSDNFFAEQTLLMAGNEFLGKMNDAAMIDTLLNGELKGLPQRPIWVDGCGLSRNDLFTPQDFVWLLDKMMKEFGLPRMKGILPTGGTGTLASYYKQDAGYIYAKTGSLSGVAALSGYLITKKDHLLIFSILINNYTGSGVTVRRQMEQWIHRIRENY